MTANDAVIITGIGIVSSLGVTASEAVSNWKAGNRAEQILLPELADTPLEGSGVAVMPFLDVGQRLGSRRMLKYMSDAARFGCAAAREALEEAAIQDRYAPERIGIFSGTGLSAANLEEVRPILEKSIDSDNHYSEKLLGEQGLAEANPLLSFKVLPNMPPCLISIIENIKGANMIFNPWEGQAAAAIMEARQAVADGEVDCALAGGADNAVHPATFVYLRQAGLIGEHEFPGAGAAYVVLERAEAAEAAGRTGYSLIRNMRLYQNGRTLEEPLAARMGRTYAAAPAIGLAIAAGAGHEEFRICGTDGQTFEIELEKLS